MLFKYLSPDRVDVLRNLRIRFSQSFALNDPYESTYSVATSFDVSEFIKNNRLDFFKYMQDEGFDTNIPEINTEIQKSLVELEKYAYENNSPEVNGKILSKLINSAQGVLSLSRTNKSLLMWAHYAASHRGFVLGLDETHSFFHQPDYEERRTNPRNVIYNTIRTKNSEEDHDLYEKLNCYKSIDWAYEEEVRIFRSFGKDWNDLAKSPLDKIYLFALPPDCIKHIYLGANCSMELQEKILSCVKFHKLSVEIFSASVSREKYELDFIKLPKIESNYGLSNFYWGLAENNRYKYSAEFVVGKV